MADPIQALIDYVNTIKPFHSKVLDVGVGYTHNERVDLTFTDVLNLEIAFEFPANVDEDNIPVRVCPNAWGFAWDRVSPYVVVDADPTTDELTVQGNYSSLFVPGMMFEVRDPDGVDPELHFTVVTSTFNSTTNNTTIQVLEDILPGDFIVPPYPVGYVSNGDIFFTYQVVATSTQQNTITVIAPSVDELMYARQFTIRNATEPTLEKTYHILTIASYSGSPFVAELIVLEPVLADTTNDGEMVMTELSWDSPSMCGDVPIGWEQNHFIENLELEWEDASGSPFTSTYQYFILEADTGNNQFVVFGDARADISVGTNEIEVIHAVTTPYSDPFNASLSANNGTYDVLAVDYDHLTNRTTISVPAVPAATPTGYIVPA